MSDKSTRRRFLQAGAAGLAAGAVARPTAAQAPQSAAKLPVMGLIGCGGMGRANMKTLMEKGVPFAAVCDVDARHARQAAQQVEMQQQRRPEEFRDYRKLLERKDIDAVIIATPDHWHALPTIDACDAGKDIYLEKPIAHNITEGRAMVAAARRNRRVVQVGTWQRSTREFVDAVEYIRSGSLGKIVTARAWKTDGFRMGRNTPKDPPSELDYDMWVGPAEMIPYTGKNCHFDWRWYWNYGLGMTGDWGVHMMDIALLGMSKDTDLVMPEEVSAYGGKLAWPDDDRTTPDTHIALMKFPGWVMHWETGRQNLDFQHDHGTEFIAEDGSTLIVWRGGWRILGPDGKERPRPESRFRGPDHWQNFLDCVQSREAPRSNLASMHQTTTVCHLANMALLAESPVRWDRERDDLAGRAGRDTLPYRREYRRPWSLPRAR